MKTYKVYVRYLVTVEVEAENETAAFNAALENTADGDWETLDVTVEPETENE